MPARVALVAALLPLCATQVPAAQPASAESRPVAGQSLYHRLGGYDALAAVTDDFIGRLAGDAKLKRFFVGLSDNSKGRVRQLVLDQLCFATGGPCVYIGRDMKTVHAGLHITEDDWSAASADLTATLERFKVGSREREEVFALLAKLKPDIVEGS
ncbi:MAG: group 1 truncated hemoglobin [bacterium]|nr:group 1 truncated hemoglobin [bacterium]